MTPTHTVLEPRTEAQQRVLATLATQQREAEAALHDPVDLQQRRTARARLDVVRRERAALMARAHQQSLGEMPGGSRPTAVLAHHSPWFLERLTAHLADRGIRVVAAEPDIASAAGAAAAEQPSLVLLEDREESSPGESVVRDVIDYCPNTLVTATCASSDRVGLLLDAGARTVFTRRVTPVDVAQQLTALLAASH